MFSPPRHVAQGCGHIDFRFGVRLCCFHFKVGFHSFPDDFQDSVDTLHAHKCWAGFDLIDVKLNFPFGVENLDSRDVLDCDPAALKLLTLEESDLLRLVRLHLCDTEHAFPTWFIERQTLQIESLIVPTFRQNSA